MTIRKEFIITQQLQWIRNKSVIYAVARGRCTGIYDSWEACQEQVHQYPQARFKKFKKEADAIKYLSIDFEKEPVSLKAKANANTSSKPPDENCRIIYCDGSSRQSSTTKKITSGYGVYFGPDDERNAAVPLCGCTNQQAELHALNHVFKYLLKIKDDKSYTIKTDSKYAINCVTKWGDKWEMNGYKSKGKPLINLDLIKSTRLLYKEAESYFESNNQKLKIEHVYGHRGNVGNEEADKLASIGASNSTPV